jgi:hypothetical protein
MKQLYTSPSGIGLFPVDAMQSHASASPALMNMYRKFLLKFILPAFVIVQNAQAYSISGKSSTVGLGTVKLSFFTAERKGEFNELTWETVAENKAGKFEVYRSYDGSSWYLTGTVSCAGFSSGPLRYSCQDQVKETEQHTYYMLRHIDREGMDEYFRIVMVNSANVHAEGSQNETLLQAFYLSMLRGPIELRNNDNY